MDGSLATGDRGGDAVPPRCSHAPKVPRGAAVLTCSEAAVACSRLRPGEQQRPALSATDGAGAPCEAPPGGLADVHGVVAFATRLSSHFGMVTLCDGAAGPGSARSERGVATDGGAGGDGRPRDALPAAGVMDVLVRTADGLSADDLRSLFDELLGEMPAGGTLGDDAFVWDGVSAGVRLRVRGFFEMTRPVPSCDGTDGSGGAAPAPCLHALAWCTDATATGRWECAASHSSSRGVGAVVGTEYQLVSSGSGHDGASVTGTAKADLPVGHAAMTAQREAAGASTSTKSRPARRKNKNEDRAARLVDLMLDVVGHDTLAATSVGVLDVAGGGVSGGVAFELATRHSIPCTTIDPRPVVLNRKQRRTLEFRRRCSDRLARGLSLSPVARQMSARFRFTPAYVPGWFGGEPYAARQAGTELESPSPTPGAGVAVALDGRLVRECTAIVGMHPDQATDAIVTAALARGVPFFVVPCCVFPSHFTSRRLPSLVPGGDMRSVRSYEDLVEYIATQSEDIRATRLPFDGRNTCLWWRPT